MSINGLSPRIFVSGSCDSTARMWDTRVASRAVHTYHGHEGDVNAVKFFQMEIDLELGLMMVLAGSLTSEQGMNFKCTINSMASMRSHMSPPLHFPFREAANCWILKW